jgi:hypothetical protein
VRRRDGTHHDHSLETETDVAVRRLFAAAGDGQVTIGWDYPGRTLLEVRILRSVKGPAAGPDDVGATLVYDDVTGSFRDTGLENGRAYTYSVFARLLGGEWVRWEDLELSPGRASTPPAPDGRTPPAGAGWTKPGAAGIGALALAVAALILTLALVLGTAIPAVAEEGGQDAGQPAEAVAGTNLAVVAWDLAVADGVVAGLLDGRQPAKSAAAVELWPPADDPRGATVYLLWPESPGIEIDGELPVVRREEPDDPPVPPYEIVTHRVRASEVTGLRALVDLRTERVLEVYPWDEHADYVLHEDTTAPASWLPWFTANAWVLLPVFGGVALYLGVRAYLRSRAWRRRLPSMSRHDRQFVGRMLVALLMMVAVVVMALAIWRAVSVPILDPDRLVGGDLATWPLVLFPPLLYLAAIGLELTSDSHRVAWGMVAVISGVSCVYSLVAMQEATVTNLTLLYYILLGCLTLVAIPRAFSAGKLGWSRSMGRAGG